MRWPSCGRCSSMTDKPDDRELEQYLTADRPLSRRYREASGETPPPELDEAILARARAAVKRKPASLARWSTGIALAASVVLGVNLGGNVYRVQPLPGEAVPMKDVAQSRAEQDIAPAPSRDDLAQPAESAAVAGSPDAARSAPAAPPP